MRIRSAVPSLADTALNTLLLGATMAIACSALWPIYRTPHLLIVVGVAVLAGSAIAIAGAWLRWSAPVVAIVTVLSFVALGVPVAVPDQANGVLPTVEGLISLLAGVALGWKQLLTISLPVGSYQGLFVPFFALILVVTVVSLSTALRAKRGALAATGPAVVYLTAVAFGQSTEFWSTLTSLSLLGLSLVWVALRAARRRRQLTGSSRGWRYATAGVLIFSCAVGAAIVAPLAVPLSSERHVLRSATEQPFDPRDYVSPLSTFRTYWDPTTEDQVLMTVDGLPEGARLRIAALDTYNGIVYSVGAADQPTTGLFTRVPFQFDRSDVSGTPVLLQVQIGAYSGPWLPSTGLFESAQFSGADATALRDSLFYNSTTGTAAVVGGLTAGDSYTLAAVIPTEPDEAEIASLDAGTAPVVDHGTVPAALVDTLDGYVGDLTDPGEQLAAVITGLRADGYVSHGGADEPLSRSGHAADRITELLTATPMIGDAEQYAVTAALMAGELGFPSRVVMGFMPTGSDVVGSDVSAWIEVNTAQYGWVSIDPTPAGRDIPEEVPEEPTTISRPQSIVPPEASTTEQDDRPALSESNTDDPAESDPAAAVVLLALRWAGLGLAFSLILLSPALLILAIKLRRRRRRRRAPTALGQISGAWSEFHDALVDHGYIPTAAATRSEVARLVPGTRSQVLAAVVDRAVFAPTDPHTAEVEPVWRAVDELRASLSAGTTRWQRLMARISPRSLRRYSGRSRFTRTRGSSQ
ncbi:MAG TPA: transglutaminaseTgpA domain-containing protein [Glaciihabitans sp.]|nr:transglutaminaseTgpA domain-containing protein [Glaciihabitans sp.]